MKRQPGKDILIFGSGSVVSQLTEHGLIDEYRFIIASTLLGRPNAAHRPGERVRLKLGEVKEYPSATSCSLHAVLDPSRLWGAGATSRTR
jgi:dihydrofolate reductase